MCSCKIFKKLFLLFSLVFIIYIIQTKLFLIFFPYSLSKLTLILTTHLRNTHFNFVAPDPDFLIEHIPEEGEVSVGVRYRGTLQDGVGGVSIRDNTRQVRNSYNDLEYKSERDLLDKLSDFMDNKFSNESSYDFLYIINELEIQIYKIVDCDRENHDRSAKRSFINRLFYDAKLYLAKNNFDIKFKYKSGNFFYDWKVNKKIRDCAGVILHRNREGEDAVFNHEILFVFWRENDKVKLSFPFGKIDFHDTNQLRTTALREAYEEINYLWPAEDELTMFVDTPFYVKLSNDKYIKKKHRFYFFKNFINEIDPKFKRDNEIDGNIWIKVKEVRKYFSQCKIYKNNAKRIDFIKNKFETEAEIFSNKVVHFTDSVKNFFMRKSKIRHYILHPDHNTENVRLNNIESNISESFS